MLDRPGFPAASHGYKNLLALLHSYPRDELIQVDEASLTDTTLGVLRLGDRRRTRLFLRRDLYGRFFSCFVYLPRESFNTDVRVKIQEILKRRLAGTSAEYTVQLTDAVLARIHLLVRTSEEATHLLEQIRGRKISFEAAAMKDSASPDASAIRRRAPLRPRQLVSENLRKSLTIRANVQHRTLNVEL